LTRKLVTIRGTAVGKSKRERVGGSWGIPEHAPKPSSDKREHGICVRGAELGVWGAGSRRVRKGRGEPGKRFGERPSSRSAWQERPFWKTLRVRTSSKGSKIGHGRQVGRKGRLVEKKMFGFILKAHLRKRALLYEIEWRELLKLLCSREKLRELRGVSDDEKAANEG